MEGTPPHGYGSKLNHQGTTGVSPCFHLPGCHFGVTSSSFFDPQPLLEGTPTEKPFLHGMIRWLNQKATSFLAQRTPPRNHTVLLGVRSQNPMFFFAARHCIYRFFVSQDVDGALLICFFPPQTQKKREELSLLEAKPKTGAEAGFVGQKTSIAWWFNQRIIRCKEGFLGVWLV